MKNYLSRTIGAGLATVALAAAAAPAFAAAATDGGLVQNYDFAAAADGTYAAGSAGIPNWNVGLTGVDVYGSALFTMPTATPSAKAIDLAGSMGDDSRGSVSQALTGLAENTQYIVTYQASAHKCPEDTGDRLVKEAHVTVDGVLVPQANGDGTIDISVAGGLNGAGQTAWTDRSFVFNTGAGQTSATIAFLGDSLGGCGVLLTDVSAASVGAAPLMDPLVVGSTLAAAGLVGFGVWTVRRRRTATAAS